MALAPRYGRPRLRFVLIVALLAAAFTALSAPARPASAALTFATLASEFRPTPGPITRINASDRPAGATLVGFIVSVSTTDGVIPAEHTCSDTVHGTYAIQSTRTDGVRSRQTVCAIYNSQFLPTGMAFSGTGTGDGQNFFLLYWIDGLAISPLDQIKSDVGVGAAFDTGATETTAQAHELLLGVVSMTGVPAFVTGDRVNGTDNACSPTPEPIFEEFAAFAVSSPFPDLRGSFGRCLVAAPEQYHFSGPLNDPAARWITTIITLVEEGQTPLARATSAALAYTENAGAVPIDPLVALSNPHAPTLSGAQVAITGGLAPAQDLLQFPAQPGTSSFYDPTSGVLSLTGTATTAQYQAALRTVTYTNTSDAPSTAPRTITFTFQGLPTEGASSTVPVSASRTVNVSAVNDAPVNTVPGAQGTPGNTPLTFSAPGNAISVADVDAGGADVQTVLTVPAGQGTLSPGVAGTVPPLTSATGSGTNVLTLVGSLAEVNAALNGLTYTPPNGFSGQVLLTVTTNDLGNTGSGGPLQDPNDTVQITVGVLPTISINDPAAVAEGDPGAPNSLVFTVTLSPPSNLAVTVPFTTANGTTAPATGGPACTANVDYVTTAGTVTFAPTETSKTIVVPICGDAVVESNETLLVNLVAPTNATLADNQGVGTIADGDQAGSVSFVASTASVPESAGTATITVQRTGGAGPAATASSAGAPAGTALGAGVPSGSVVPGGSVRPNPPTTPASGPAAPGVGTVAPSALSAVSVQYATADVVATAGLDYVPVSGTLSFGVNETTKTIVIPIINDSLQEGPEQFTIILSNPTGGASLGQAVITVTIIDTTHGAPTPPGDDSADDERVERERETEEERRQRARTNQGNKDDDAVEGDVIEVRCDQPWPSVVIANRDGAVEVKLIKEAQRACSSISVGDYLEADGEKQHEGLFHADSVDIRRRR